MDMYIVKRTDDAYLPRKAAKQGFIGRYARMAYFRMVKNPDEVSPNRLLNGKLTEQKYAILLRIFILK